MASAPAPKTAGLPGGALYDNEDGGYEHPVEVPAIAYGTAHTDNNANRMVGARLRRANTGRVMIHVAGFRGAYDPEGALAIDGINLSMKWQPVPWYFRGEGIILSATHILP